MINLKVIARFLVIFLITYTLLLLPQTGIDRKYAEFYCSIGNKLYHNFGNEGVVILKTQNEKNNLFLGISKSSLIQSGEVKGDIFYAKSNLMGYYFTAFFLALVIATPLTWKRKFFALFLGLILVTAFVMLKLRVIILYNYTQTPWLGLYQDSSVKESMIFWNKYFVDTFTLGYSFVVIVWLGVCIGKKEWKNLNGVFSAITANKKSVMKSHQTSKQGNR